MRLDSDSFREYLTGFQVSAWRWECQPSYGIPREQPALVAYIAGEAKPSDMNSAWHERVRGIVSSGRSIGRVRGVRYPLTEYQRFQLDWAYPDNSAAGEEIGVADLTDDSNGLPKYDFWLVDDQHVIRMNFDDDGRLTSRELLDNPELGQYLQWKNTALRCAVPLDRVRT